MQPARSDIWAFEVLGRLRIPTGREAPRTVVEAHIEFPPGPNVVMLAVKYLLTEADLSAMLGVEPLPDPAPEYMPILDSRRLDDEHAEARRLLDYYRLMFVSGNANPVRQRMIEAHDIVVRDTAAFFERWPENADPPNTPGSQ